MLSSTSAQLACADTGNHARESTSGTFPCLPQIARAHNTQAKLGE